MSHPISSASSPLTPSPLHPVIPSLRSSSRLLIRELGFMSSTVAQTQHPPSAVHAIIEIGAATAKNKEITAGKLCEELCLEKSSVSRMLRKLVESGEVCENVGGRDGRERILSLTEKGKMTLDGIDHFAHKTITSALSHLSPPSTPTTLTTAFRAYALALRSSRLHLPPSTPPAPASLAALQSPSSIPYTIHTGYTPSLLARCLTLHMAYYAPAFNLGAAFESMLACGFGDLVGRLEDSEKTGNQVWFATDPGNEIQGTVLIDGEDLNLGAGVKAGLSAADVAALGQCTKRKAHLRGFIVGEQLRGRGVGKSLMERVVGWIDGWEGEGGERFEECHLWMFESAMAARKLYEAVGFVCVDEVEEERWGRLMKVCHFVRLKGVEIQGKVA